MGLPHAIAVTTVNITDRIGSIPMVNLHRENLKDCTKIIVDGAYTGDKFSDSVKEIISATTEVIKRTSLHTFNILPKRWIIERTLHNSLQALSLAFIHLLLTRL